MKRASVRQRPGRHPCAIAERLEERLCLAVFTVTTDVDSGPGSLRDAINRSNNTAGHDTIDFARPFFDSPRTINLASKLPQILSGSNSAVTIIGPGSQLLTLRRPATTLTYFPGIDCYAPALNLSGMTISGGNNQGNGGGIGLFGADAIVNLDDLVITNNTASFGGGVSYAGGVAFGAGAALHVENCNISGNTSTSTSSNAGAGGLFFGGPIATNAAGFIPGTVLVRNSTISNNNTTGKGGGILLGDAAGTVLVQNSTISGNSANNVGGGISSDGTTPTHLIVQNSTLSGNTSGAAGGGISLTAGQGIITVQNSTLTANRANGTSTTFIGGGGIARLSPNPGSLTIANSIVSGNTDASNAGPDIRASAPTTTHINHSAIGSPTGFTLSPSSGNNLAYGANLMLGPLASNGGPTLTHAPQPGSPLLNAGSNARIPADISDLDQDGNTTEPLPFDQRGAARFPRIVGSAVDIGAVEVDNVPPAVLLAQYMYFLHLPFIGYTFSEDVGASLDPADFQFRNLTTSTDIPGTQFQLQYDAPSRTAYLLYMGGTLGVLPDGNYRATLLASGVEDPAGNHLAANHLLDFYVLAADANRDRKVDFNDLVILAQNYGASGKTFTQGNFNYTLGGFVDFNDLVVLAQRYGTQLAPASPAAPISETDENQAAQASVFSTTPLERRPAQHRAAARKSPTVRRPR